MATEITDPRILSQLGVGQAPAAGKPRIIAEKPADQPPPRTAAQAAVDAANAQFAGVNPNLQAKAQYQGQISVKAYEASMPLFKAALQTSADKSGDNQLITYAAKLSDPTTGVLGAERENYAAATTAAERLKLYINNEIKPVFNENGDVIDFKGLMSPNSRRTIRNELTKLMLARNEAYNLTREDWAATAKALNLNPQVVIGPHAGEKFRGFLRKYDVSNGVTSPKLVAPAVGPETGGSKTYRFSPEREQEIIDYVASDKFTPAGYTNLISKAAKEAGVNVDSKYLELSLAEGNRLLKAKKEGKPIAGAVSYQKADATYEKQLDEYNKRLAKMEGETLRASIFGQESPYATRFAAGTGLADEASGLGAGLGAVLQGGEFGPAYEMARDAATRRVQLLREQQSGLQGALGMASELAGGVGTAVAPAGAISRARTLSQLSPTARTLIGETVTGAGLGALEAAPDQRLRGAVIGGGASPVFAGVGAAGQRFGNVIVGGLPAGSAPMSRQLLREGIVPTPGQIGQETGGRIGREVSLREQAATSAPFIGPAIAERRNESILAANLAAGRRSLSAIDAQDQATETGLALRNQLDQAVSDAYDAALQPMQLQVDAPFRRAQRTINNRLNRINQNDPTAMREIRNIWQDYVAPFIEPNGRISGQNLQAIKRSIQEQRNMIEQMPGAQGALDVIDDIENALFDGLARRQAPDLYDAYRNADRAYRESRIVTNAITSAETRPGSPGIFTPSQLATQVRASERKFGPSDIGGAGGFSEAATTVLPATLAESGTTPRSGMMSLLTGGGTGGAIGAMLGNPILGGVLGLGAGALASVPYSRVGNRLIANTLLAPRPAALNSLSTYLARNPQIGRSLGMAAGLDYVTPEQDFGGRPSMLTPEQQALINIYAGGR